ncbi:protein Ycf2-like [Vigna angularis]|uniref:protein Ycf2-like n=1 Tax=Phaseolus angularis TaxID=3914 RepID=UPI0022B451C0|nr:protein Ycf2-like [Vigna angularis]
MEDHFEVVFHHGGHFINDGPLKYEGESTTLSFDPNMWSYFIVVSVVKGLGYDGFKELWYCVGGFMLDNRLEPLCDKGAMHMINLARLNGEVHLFVVHTVSKPEIMHLLENVPHNIGEEEVQPVMHDSGDGECEQGHGECQEEGDGECEQGHGECQEEGDGECEQGHAECQEESDGECEQGHGECQEEGDGECQQGHGEVNDVVVERCEVPVSEQRCEGDDVVEGQIEAECDVGQFEGDDVDVHSWSSNGEDANVDCNVDVNDDCMEDLVDSDIQEEVGHGVENWFGEIEVDVQDDGPSWTHMSDSDVDDGINTDNDRDLSGDN